MSANEIRDFIFEKYYEWIGFSKENSYYLIKRLKTKYSLLLTNNLIEKNLTLAMLKKAINHLQQRKKQ